MDFSNWVDLKEINKAKLFLVSKTNSKPSASGFEFERRNNGAREYLARRESGETNTEFEELISTRSS